MCKQESVVAACIGGNAQELLWGVCILPAPRRLHLQMDASIRGSCRRVKVTGQQKYAAVDPVAPLG